MRGSADRAARAALHGALQRAASCVTPSVLVDADFATIGRREFQFSGGLVRLRGVLSLTLSVVVEVATDGAATDSKPPMVTVVGYRSELRLVDGPMLIAYHWHPVGVSPVTTPHLHLGGAVAGVDLPKAHLPTGQVTLQDVVRFVITEWGVRPRRDDWPAVLASA